jgi:hypothetical protein
LTLGSINLLLAEKDWLRSFKDKPAFPGLIWQSLTLLWWAAQSWSDLGLDKNSAPSDTLHVSALINLILFNSHGTASNSIFSSTSTSSYNCVIFNGVATVAQHSKTLHAEFTTPSLIIQMTLTSGQ